MGPGDLGSLAMVTYAEKKLGPMLLILVNEEIETNSQNVYIQPHSLFLKRNNLFAIPVKKVRHLYS